MPRPRLKQAGGPAGAAAELTRRAVAVQIEFGLVLSRLVLTKQL
jgi:hypothetical protein